MHMCSDFFFLHGQARKNIVLSISDKYRTEFSIVPSIMVMDTAVECGCELGLSRYLNEILRVIRQCGSDNRESTIINTM